MSMYGDNIFTLNEKGIISKALDYHFAITSSSKVAVNATINALKKKLDSMDSEEEKRNYLNKQKRLVKGALTYRQNQAKTTIMKNHMKDNYQKLFDFLDSELEKLK